MDLRKTSWVMGVAVLALSLTLACGKKTTEGGDEGPALQDLYVLSVTPIDTNGRFEVSVVGVSDQNEVFDLASANITVSVDSVSYYLLKDKTIGDESRPAEIRVPVHSGAGLAGVTDTAYQVNILGNQFQQLSASGDMGISLNFDNSGSLTGTDPNNLRIPAGKDFIRILNQAGRTSDLVGIFGFARTSGDANGDSMDDYYFEILQDYTSPADTAALFAALDSLNANDLTPLWCSLVLNMDYAASQSWSGRAPVLVSFTDGGDNDSYNCPRKDYASGTITNQNITMDSVIQVAQRTSHRVFFVALSYYSQEMQTIAQQTGGMVVLADSAGALQRLFQGMGYSVSGGFNQIQMQVQPVPPLGMNVYLSMEVCSGGQCRTAHIRAPGY